MIFDWFRKVSRSDYDLMVKLNLNSIKLLDRKVSFNKMWIEKLETDNRILIDKCAKLEMDKEIQEEMRKKNFG